MTYAFLKRFNPAYDFFLVKYFNDARVQLSTNSKYDEIANLEASSLKSMTERDILEAYVSRWRDHPEVRPSYIELFERIPGISLGYAEMKRLEEQLPEKGKIIFSMDEASSTILDFYRRQIERPLRKALQDGMSERQILKSFLTPKELKSLPDSKVSGSKVWRSAIKKEATELLASLSELSDESMQSSIKRVLNLHLIGGSQHLHFGEMIPKGPKLWSCNHQSDWIRLSCLGESQDNLDMFLQPSRGYDNNAYESDSNWNLIGFPSYRVIEY